MSEPSTPETEPTTTNAPSPAPFEGALNTAFNKLTSQILIFLLAYVILLIGVAVFGAGIESRLLSLFYILPILGVTAYVWLQRRQYVSQPVERNVKLIGGITRGGSTVVGESGRFSDAPGSTTVRSLFASGESTVAGRMMPDAMRDKTSISSDFMAVYQQLTLENRIKLLGTAQSLLTKQENRNG